MALVSIEGQIQNLNYTTRTFTLKDKTGIMHPVKYAAGHDEKMQKQKNYWGMKVTGETGEDGVLVLDVCEFWKIPDDFPKGNSGGGKGGNYQQRDPKIQTYIIRQSCLDRATQIVLHGAVKESELPALVKDIKEVAEVLEGWVLR